MCDISKKTRRKTVTVYKIVDKYKDEYYALFSGVPVKTGKAIKQNYSHASISTISQHYEENNCLYNPNMVGKCSGFELQEDAYVFIGSAFEALAFYRRVLKVVLGGEIWEGTTKYISMLIPDDHKIFAGTEILSIKEV